ncbi:penicillin-binding protein 1A [Noviherbaspirillum sedimenti]|uniref:Penicillin-binding protein 1A n=1 Tax=Noviherbaspirillum sedimenti TaxID=2320865 RepID=A0A3A3GPE1_9BURK|nr:PBP1A family penicillin-binding protein [Noviherbaspirillum sedimenti]RJG02850.1 PBP1A family penicillin-binding protein [Noviherbaspirillum sedimenti]
MKSSKSSKPSSSLKSPKSAKAAKPGARPGRWRLGGFILASLLVVLVLGGLLATYALVLVGPTLPKLDALTDYRPKIPLRVYTADNVLIGEFGEERREFVPIKQMPTHMTRALLAIEDENFYRHDGVDYKGVLRAALSNIVSGGNGQGASTITMQVARNFFLTREKSYTRKINEIMLAYKIEKELSKDQILELYMNQIYLGERAYGFATAAYTYFGKPIRDISAAEAAMLAGLPKAPSTMNPVVNPKRARQRQLHILKRMHELNFISDAEYRQAAEEKLVIRGSAQRYGAHAEYAAEQVRKFMFAQFKEETYTRGFNVTTTLLKADQDAAYAALRRGVLDYDRRHGYRGPEAFIKLPADEEERDQAIAEALLKYPDSGELESAVVLAASPKVVRAQMLSGEEINITGDGVRFAAAKLASKAENGVRAGAVIRVMRDTRQKWTIVQLPEVAAAFVALNAHDGSYRALVGGFDFGLSQFDHVSQAWRQPGSTIKPFVYSAALEKGMSPGTLINDAPLETVDANGKSWAPQNDNGSYDGPVSMRYGLKRSKNLVSIRLLQQITPPYAQNYLGRFGFSPDKHPDNLTLALGTGSVTPLQMASAYAVFANGGYQREPYLIARITDARGNVLAQKPAAGNDSERVLDVRNAYLMDSMLRDAAHSGTAAAAGQKLGRADLAGKTGTTNDALDGWFAGYAGDVVAVAWMGYDTPKSLGNREFGSTLALPIWVDYMRVALRGKPDSIRPVPDGLVQINGDLAYQEFAEQGAVRTVGMEARDPISNLWHRLFGSSPTPPAGEVRERPQAGRPSQQQQTPISLP